VSRVAAGNGTCAGCGGARAVSPAPSRSASLAPREVLAQTRQDRAWSKQGPARRLIQATWADWSGAEAPAHPHQRDRRRRQLLVFRESSHGLGVIASGVLEQSAAADVRLLLRGRSRNAAPRRRSCRRQLDRGVRDVEPSNAIVSGGAHGRLLVGEIERAARRRRARIAATAPLPKHAPAPWAADAAGRQNCASETTKRWPGTEGLSGERPPSNRAVMETRLVPIFLSPGSSAQWAGHSNRLWDHAFGTCF
jgi:hypothetical protein